MIPHFHPNSTWYCCQRPFGFLLDVDMNGGKKRRFHYFDAWEPERLKNWVDGAHQGYGTRAWASEVCPVGPGIRISRVFKTRRRIS